MSQYNAGDRFQCRRGYTWQLIGWVRKTQRFTLHRDLIVTSRDSRTTSVNIHVTWLELKKMIRLGGS